MSRTTIRVFEHDRLVIGQSITTEDSATATFERRHFDAIARYADTSPVRIVEIGHRSIRFANYVGYLQIDDLGIEVLPKADRHASANTTPWHDALLDMVGVAHGLRLVAPTNAYLRLRRSSLLDIYVTRFLEQVEGLLHQGLVRGYRRIQENRRSFRGRLLVAENLRANLVQAQRVFLEHQVYDHDTLVNQTLQAALGVLEQSHLGAALKSRLTQIRGAMPETVSALGDIRRLDSYVPTRNTQRYAEAMQMARLILEHRGPQLQTGCAPILALMFDMNALWERYIAAHLRRLARPTLRIVAQDAHRFWKRPGHRVRSVKPDIVVRDQHDGKPLLVLDTKWKVPRHGQPSDSDLKQMFVYNELYDCDRSLLVYPAATAGQAAADGTFVQTGRLCGTRYVSLFEGGEFSSAAVGRSLTEILHMLAR